ncbi:MAG: fibronectin type III domain-containing protein, partial [Candidatus Limnocylindrales bacterium]
SNEASATPTAPATAPGAPTGLAATASSSQINLSWTAPANNGGSAIMGYMIERSTDSGTTWSTISSSTGSTATTYYDTGLAASTAYTYQVSAINGIGTGSPSNTASATTSVIISTGIALSNTQSTSGTVSPSNTITISGFNVGSDSNRLLVVEVSANNNDVASVTFAGVPLKNIAYSFYNNDAEFWYLKNPGGTGDITVTMNGPTQAVVGAYSFSGVNQTTPIPTHIIKHNTNPNSPKISITTKYANDWVLDLPSIYGGATLGTPTCTQQWDINVPDGITGASSSVIVPTPATVTCKWTASSADFWDDAAVEINAAR